MQLARASAPTLARFVSPALPRVALLLFAGPPRGDDSLRSALARRGWGAVEIDLLRSENELYMNLADDTSWEHWVSRIRAGEFAFIFAAPPCETWSRARRTQPGPPILRTLQEPWGRAGLPPTLKDKVRTANLLIKRVLHACKEIVAVGGGFAVENPAPWPDWPSLFGTRAMKLLTDEVGATDVSFDQCCHGAAAMKPTLIRYRTGGFGVLAARCAHPARRWPAADGRGSYLAPHETLVGRRRPTDPSTFVTKNFAAYPAKLNEHLAACISVTNSAGRPGVAPPVAEVQRWE